MTLKPLTNKKHVKVYLEYFGYGEQDYMPCEMCGKRAVDCHHIVYRSQGRDDGIENIIGLCRECHDLAHDNTFEARDLRLAHKRFMAFPTTGVMGKKL